MKRFVCLLFVFSYCILSFAQYNSGNSFMRHVIVKYEKGADGYYSKSDVKQVDAVEAAEDIYAFDKKASNLYVITKDGNYEITLTKDYAKLIRKNKSIPQLKDDELTTAIKKANEILETRYSKLNEENKQRIIAERQKAIEDSIAEVRRLEALKAAAEKKKADYISTHDWHWIPTKSVSLSCSEDDCSKHLYEDTVYCCGIKNDTLYYLTREDLKLGIDYAKMHYCKVPQKLIDNDNFQYHYEVFKDSLTSSTILNHELVNAFNIEFFLRGISELQKEAPYGFFGEWGWDDDFSVSFHFNYTNTYKKTIKYIDVSFVIKNGVGDVRGTGHFSGTGPLEFLDSGSWEWESSPYYVAGDASDMYITKVIITYTDGSKKTLTGNNIVFESEYE